MLGRPENFNFLGEKFAKFALKIKEYEKSKSEISKVFNLIVFKGNAKDPKFQQNLKIFRNFFSSELFWKF